MKKITTLLFTAFMLFGLSGSLMGQEQIYIEDFEDGTVGYTTSVAEFNDGDGDFFTRTDGSGLGGYTVSNVQGTYFFAAMDLDGDGENSEQTLTFSDINIAGYESLELRVYLAEDDDGTNQDWDAGDFVHFDYDIDDSGTFTELLWVENPGGTNAAPQIDTDFDGIGDGTEITDTFAQFTPSISGTGGSLDLKITIKLDDGDTDIAIDNVEIWGTSTGGSPTQLAVTEINGGNSPSVDTSFDVVVQAQDGSGTPLNVSSDTDITLSLGTGNGAVGGTLTGTISNGTNQTTITGVTYNTAESGVTVTASDDASGLSSGTSSSFEVLEAAGKLVIKDFPSNGIENATINSFTVEAQRNSDNSIDLNYSEDITISKASGSGSISGTVTKSAVNGVATFNDISFDQVDSYTIDATDGTLTSATSSSISVAEAPKLIISEVADPGDIFEGRFVELFNAGSSTIDFSSDTYYFVKQVNGGTIYETQLTGSVDPGETYLLADQADFNANYGFNPDLDIADANANGDDAYWLATDGTDDASLKSNIVDIYGVVDIDGTGEAWEYEDARAVRKNNISSANPTWTSSEWMITSADVADMTPGERFELEISGTEGWRIVTAPISNKTYDDLLGNIWTQGITNSDAPSNGTPNVQVFDGSGFNAVGNLASTMNAGIGFITYVYSDDDYDGSAEGFPKTLSVSGTANTGTVTPTLTSGADAWTLVGNPYTSTIDWDDLGKTDLTVTVYVYDHSYGTINGGGNDVAADVGESTVGGYRTWNGTVGSLTDGLIVPFQGFWVQNASSGSPALTIEEADKSTGGTFYKESQDAPVAIKLHGQMDNMYSESFLSFTENGEVAKDNFDGLKLSPLDFRPYLSVAIVTGDTKLDINNLPNAFEDELSIPISVEAFATDNEEGTWVNRGGEVTLSWPVMKNLPDEWSVTLNDTKTGAKVNMRTSESYVFDLAETQKAKTGPTMTILNPQPPQAERMAKGGERPRFTVTVTNNSTTNTELGDTPQAFTLEQNYPNPFNPTTSIQYSVAKAGEVQLSIYNVMGQQVETLVSGNKSAGSYRVSWNAANMASGIYYYRLQAGNEVITRQMTLIK